MSVNERVNFLINSLTAGNKSAFAKSIGVGAGVVQDIIGGRLNKPSFDLLNKIVNTYPKINLDWLVTGEGEPFKNGRELEEKSIVHTVGEVPATAIPLYDIEINAGNVTRIIEDNNNIPVVGWLQLEELPNRNGFIGVRAKGKSMASFIDNGDHLIIKPLKNRRFVALGEAYVIITDEQAVVKYIRAGSTPETYTLRSHNYTMFEDFEVLKTDIKHLFLVVKVIKDVTY